MPCYRETISIPNREEYRVWQQIGYLGSFEDYCDFKARNVGLEFHVCGELGPHCADCSAVGDYLCDFPVGDNKTCDRPMCQGHAHEVGHNLHYCQAHYELWREFVHAGGVTDALKNVVAFKTEK